MRYLVELCDKTICLVKGKHENLITLVFYCDLLSNTVPFFFSHEMPSAILFYSIDTLL